MFFVVDSQDQKKRKIKEYLNREPMIAVLLAAVNFEWTVGRCILFFGKSPNIELRERLFWCYVLDKYKEVWKEELVKNWLNFKKAFMLRHRLIHGRGTCTRNMATEPVKKMLSAVDDLYNFAFSRGKDLHSRLPIRSREEVSSNNGLNRGK